MSRLDDIKVGDKVLYTDRNDMQVMAVSRVTATRISGELPNYFGQMHTRHFMKRTGREVGDHGSWEWRSIEPYSATRWATWNEKTRIRRDLEYVRGFLFSTLDAAEVADIANRLRTIKAKRKS